MPSVYQSCIILSQAGMLHGIDSSSSGLHGNQLSLTSSLATTHLAGGSGHGQQQQQQSAMSAAPNKLCRRLALITDVAAGTAVDVCAPTDGSRISHAYLSVGGLVEIRLLRHDANSLGGSTVQGGPPSRHFLLRYNGMLKTKSQFSVVSVSWPFVPS
jgi:hypothetical protein